MTQPTLAVFTVKKFRHVNGRYWTYGGFGEYIKALLPHFRKVILACHPLDDTHPPEGWYPLDDPQLEFAWLPYYEKEHQCVLKLPSMFWKCRDIVERADIVNPRVPDYTGICGGYWARKMNKPIFISHIGNWHSQVRNPPTRLTGLLKLGLQAHLALYCWFEKRLCARGLIFAQGDFAKDLYAHNPDVHLCISSSHLASDVVPFETTCTDPSVCRLLSVGRLVTLKGHTDLIRTLALLQAQTPHRYFELTIAGEGKIANTYRALAEELGVADQLKLPGQVGRADVFDLYDKYFLLVFSRRRNPKSIAGSDGKKCSRGGYLSWRRS